MNEIQFAGYILSEIIRRKQRISGNKHEISKPQFATIEQGGFQLEQHGTSEQESNTWFSGLKTCTN